MTLSVVHRFPKLINLLHGHINDVCGANASSKNEGFEANGPDKKGKIRGKIPDVGNIVIRCALHQSLRTLCYKFTFTPDSHATSGRVPIALKRCHTGVLPFAPD